MRRQPQHDHPGALGQEKRRRYPQTRDGRLQRWHKLGQSTQAAPYPSQGTMSPPVPPTAKHRFVNEWLGRDGSRRLIEWTNTLIRPTGSTQPVMVCIGVDITERHRADTVLKQHK